MVHLNELAIHTKELRWSDQYLGIFKTSSNMAWKLILVKSDERYGLIIYDMKDFNH